MTSPSLPRITVNPGVCQGQPCVRGLRIPVATVLRYLAAGRSDQQLVYESREAIIAADPQGSPNLEARKVVCPEPGRRPHTRNINPPSEAVRRSCTGRTRRFSG